jgi:methylthioribulose-1-phosphate dehydratase
MRTKKAALLEIGRQFYERQWMWGMSGNLSVRLSSDPLRFAITPSGINKGHMSGKDLITAAGPRRGASGGLKISPRHAVPSSETVVHEAVYRALPKAGAVFHVHPMYSTLISRLYGDPKKVRLLKLKGVMMMKGMIGLKETDAELAILPNWPDPAKIARDVAAYIRSSAKALPAILVYDHGLTGWGANPDQARNYLEIIEYTCRYLYLRRLSDNS